MNKRKESLIATMILLVLGFLFISLKAAAQAADLPASDFLAQVLEAYKAFGGLGAMAKVSAVIMLLVASMKVSFLNDVLWSKLGSAKVYVAPLLGLIGGLLGVGVDGHITLATIFAFVTAGAGAVFLHEILDSVKAIPGIGSAYLALINMLEGLLGKKA